MSADRITITILNRWNKAVLFSHETTAEREASGLALRDALEAAAATKANLSGANLTKANLTKANLSGANLTKADLTGANLFGADLAGANLFGADLFWADLTGANLFGADLAGANLFGADLTGANLTGANLFGADLAGANLFGADLTGATVHGLKLIGSRPLIAIGPIGGESRTVFAWLTESGLRIQADCFFGPRDEFTTRLVKTHGDNEHAQEYTAALVLIDAHARLWTPDMATGEGA